MRLSGPAAGPARALHIVGAQIICTNVCTRHAWWSKGLWPVGVSQCRQGHGLDPSFWPTFSLETHPCVHLSHPWLECIFTVRSSVSTIPRAPAGPLLWACVEWEGRVLDPTGRQGPDSALAGETDTGPDNGEDRGSSCGLRRLGRGQASPCCPPLLQGLTWMWGMMVP